MYKINLKKIAIILYIIVGLCICNINCFGVQKKAQSSVHVYADLPYDKKLVSDANAGNPTAMAELGFYYFMGEGGVRENQKEALYWFKKSANKNNPYGILGLGLWKNYNGDSAGIILQEKAFKMIMEMTEKDDIKAMYYVGVCYEGGAGVNENEKIAMQWFLKSAESGCLAAMAKVAGLTNDEDEAFYWFKELTKFDDAWGYQGLGYCYENGFGVQTSYEEAYKNYTIAAQRGVPISQLSLAKGYEDGKWGIKDFHKAIEYYKKSSDHEYTSAYRLGCIYRDGIGVNRNYDLAIKYFKLASSLCESYRENHAESNINDMKYNGREYYAKLPLKNPDDVYELKEDDPFLSIRVSDNWDSLSNSDKLIFLKNFKREKIEQWGLDRASLIAQHCVDIGFTEDQISYSQGFVYEKHFIDSPRGFIVIMQYPHCSYYLLNDRLKAMVWDNGAQIGDIQIIKTYEDNYIISGIR